MRVMRPIGHEDRLSIVDHLDELRNRLIVCVIASSSPFALCYWQNDELLEIVNKPLEQSQRSGQRQRPARAGRGVRRGARAAARQAEAGAERHRRRADALGDEPGVPSDPRASVDAAAAALAAAAESSTARSPRCPRTAGAGR